MAYNPDDRSAARPPGIEDLSLPRLLAQQRSRRQALAVTGGVAVQPLDDRPQPLAVRLAQQAAAEGGEAEAEDDPDVDVRRVGDDPLGQTARRLVQHLENAALDDLAVGDRPRRLLPAEQAVDRVVDFLPLLLAIEVEAAPRLPPQPAVGDQPLEDRRRRHP